jgi:hypothetical protein
MTKDVIETCNFQHFNNGVLKNFFLMIFIFFILCPSEKKIITFYILYPKISHT